MEFFGRESELNELLSLWGKRGGSLVTCRGRRRIGKSTLVEEFARRSKSIRTVLVYDGALAPIVETDGYFDALISFRSLLGGVRR